MRLQRPPALRHHSFPTRSAVAASLGGHLPPRGSRIGLLGGSFNPAHQAHRDISLQALRCLGLDEVWWLVSPQNPLKSRADMADLGQRVDSALAVKRDPRIRVATVESQLGTAYTAQVIRRLKRRFPGTAFVWLMGADNLWQVPQWYAWEEIFAAAPVAVFDRPGYSLHAVAGQAAQKFRRTRLHKSRARKLAQSKPPAWTMVFGRKSPLSSTAIRRSSGGVVT